MTARAPRTQAPRRNRHSSSSKGKEDTPRDALRVGVLVLLAAGPLLSGAVHEPVFIPLLVGYGLTGLASWSRARAVRGQAPGASIPALPGGRILLALHLLVLFQLLPFPPAVLRLVSPGSFAFYNDRLLLPLTAWRPLSVGHSSFSSTMRLIIPIRSASLAATVLPVMRISAALTEPTDRVRK